MLWTKYLRPVELPDHEGFDATVVVSGDTGMGKSEFGLSLALALSRETRVPFHIERNLVYTREQLDEAIRHSPRYSSIIVDEAVNVLFSRDDKKNSEIIKVLEACRSRNLAIIFCMPDFSAMDIKARNSRIRFWIEIRTVGQGMEFIRRRRTAADSRLTDPWNNWAFKEIGNHYEAHPNFIGLIRWNKIPEDLRERYLQLKNDSDLLTVKEEKSWEPDRDTMYAFLEKLGSDRRSLKGIVEKVASFLGVTSASVYQHLRQRAEER